MSPVVMARVKDGDGLVYESTERRRREETVGEEPPTNVSEFETPKGTAEMEVDLIDPPTYASKIESRKGTADMEEDSEREASIDATEGRDGLETEEPPRETENVIVMEKGIVSSRSVACVSSSSLPELASTNVAVIEKESSIRSSSSRYGGRSNQPAYSMEGDLKNENPCRACLMNVDEDYGSLALRFKKIVWFYFAIALI
ncbi:unnamed protein product [Arabidopsis lyrata]|nr:unnamed protein product [Arabidopsis lyrata]